MSTGGDRTGALRIFLSYTYPHRPEQEAFLTAATAAMAANDLEAVTLQRESWLSDEPLTPIRQLICSCVGTIVIATARTLVAKGVDYVGGSSPRAYEDRYLATEWTHIETAMAFQLGLPILVFREERVHPSGLLDPEHSGLVVRTIAVGENLAGSLEVLTRELPAFRTKAQEFAAIPST